MAERSRSPRYWISMMIAFLLIAGLFLALVYTGAGPASWSATARVITRYVEQFHIGNGFVFNPSERVLLVAAPLYMILMALLRVVFDAQSSSALLFAIATLISACMLYRLAGRAELGEVKSIQLMFLYLATSMLWIGLLSLFENVDPTLPVAVAFILVAIDIALSGKGSLAGVVLALGILCNAGSVIVAVPLLLVASEKEQGLQFLLGLLVPLTISGIALRWYYGAGWLDGVLLAKVESNSFSITWIIGLILVALAAYGWYKHRTNLVAAVFGGWIVLYGLIFVVLLRRGIDWNAVFVVAPLSLLIFLALDTVRPVILTIAVAVFTVIAFLAANPIIDSPLPPSLPSVPATVGVNSLTYGLAYRSTLDQTMVAFDGSLQPDVKTMIERGDIQSMLIRYAPDVISVEGEGRVSSEDLSSGAVARLNYRPIDNREIFARQTSVGQFKDYPANAIYGPDIVLSGLALDESTLKPGQLLRVRLDWQFSRAASRPVTIDLRLRSGEYLLAHSTDTYEPSIFRVGPWSTYHTLTVLDRAWLGPVVLEAAVIVSDGTIARVPLATLDVVPSP